MGKPSPENPPESKSRVTPKMSKGTVVPNWHRQNRLHSCRCSGISRKAVARAIRIQMNQESPPISEGIRGYPRVSEGIRGRGERNNGDLPLAPSPLRFED